MIEPDVFDQPRRVTDAVRAAPLDGLPDAFLAERFAGMNRDVEVLALDVVERVDVFLRRETAFLAGQVESDDAALAEVHGELRHLERPLQVPHGADDHAVLDAEVVLPALEARQHGGHDLVPVESLVDVENRREARLDVHHAVAVHVFDHFVGDAFERLGGLHDAAGVREALEIERQAAALGAAVKPLGEIAGVGGREAVVTLLPGQLDDRLRPQAAVEMIVQQHLGQRSNRPFVNLHRNNITPRGGSKLSREAAILAPRERQQEGGQYDCVEGTAVRPRSGDDSVVCLRPGLDHRRGQGHVRRRPAGRHRRSRQRCPDRKGPHRVTDGSGQYRIVDLRAGTYAVTFTLTGFSTVKREGVELTGSFTATVNADLKVGSLSETVTVSGETPIVDVQSARRQATVSGDVIAAIPSSRAYGAIFGLNPAVSMGAGAALDVQVMPGLSVFGGAGGRGTEGRLQLDGLNTGAPLSGGGTSGYVPDLGTAQEVSFTTSGGLGEAEVGGPVMNIVPRTGGNTDQGERLPRRRQRRHGRQQLHAGR